MQFPRDFGNGSQSTDWPSAHLKIELRLISGMGASWSISENWKREWVREEGREEEERERKREEARRKEYEAEKGGERKHWQRMAWERASSKDLRFYAVWRGTWKEVLRFSSHLARAFFCVISNFLSNHEKAAHRMWHAKIWLSVFVNSLVKKGTYC